MEELRAVQMQEAETLSEADIRRLASLYYESQYMEIWELIQPLQPLSEWTGCMSRTWAGRLAAVLGGRRLANILHWRNYRRYRQDVGAATYYAHTLAERRGPLEARMFLRQLIFDGQSAAAENLQYFHTLRAMLEASFRDFEAAEAQLRCAAEIMPDSPWLQVSRASVLEAQDRYAEALEAARSTLAENPNYRAGLLAVAHLLQILDRDEEALALLSEAVGRTRAAPLAMELAGLQANLGQYREAMASLERLEAWSPLADRSFRRWLSGTRLILACRAGDVAGARRYCQEVLAGSKRKEEHYQALAGRLAEAEPRRRRVSLAVDFVRQHHKTCAPATLAALARYWGHRADHLEVAEAICYDGTPAYSERRWAVMQGLVTREFKVTWEAAVALLERGVPFTMSTSETTSSHAQAVIGYDELQQALLLRDPYNYYISEALCPKFLEYYAPFGPRGMLILPPAEAHRLEGLELPEAAQYDQLYELELALSEHRRQEALSLYAAMQAEHPGHRLTLMAGWALGAYDANLAATLQVMEQLLALYPDCGRFQLVKYDCLSVLASRATRLEYLETLVGRRESDPIFKQRLAMELRTDGRQLERAAALVGKALRYRPLEPEFLRTKADILWEQRRLEEAADYYRLAACSSVHQESLSQSYFTALCQLRQQEKGLAFLRRRYEELGHKSAQPAMTLFECLAQVGQVQQGLELLEEARRRRPEDGELVLFQARVLERYGRYEQAGEALRQAEGRTRRNDWLRVAARLAGAEGDADRALRHWQEVLELEPLALDAIESVAKLLAQTRDMAAAQAFLEEVCRRFPGHCGLLRLRAEFVREEPFEVVEGALRGLLAANPADAWAARELAIVLAGVGRDEEAMVEAERAMALDPNHSAGYSVRGNLWLMRGEKERARADYEKALRLDVNNVYAMNKLVEVSTSAGERKAALDFIQAELVRQVVFEEALPAFYRVARGLLAPEAVLNRLREALAARPDLWSAWTVTTSQLTDMDRREEALALAREACERFPFTPQVWLELARVQQVRGEVGEALGALDRALAISPGYGQAVYQKSVLLQNSGQWEAACQTLEEGVAQAPLDAQLHAFWAEALWKTGRREAAMDRLRRALRVGKNPSWVWDMLQQWAAELGQPKLAVELAREQVSRRPGEPESWLILADCLAASGNGESLEAVNRAIELNPRWAEAYDRKAWILTKMNRCQEAIEVCRQAPFDPLPPTLRMRLAWVLAQAGRLPEAVAEMETALAEAPASFTAWQLLCLWCRQMGKLDRAAAAADHMALLSPQDPVPLMQAAHLFAQKGERREAIARARRALQLNASDEEALAGLAAWLAEEAEAGGDWSEVSAFLKETEGMGERDYLIILRLRWCLRQGKGAEALQEFGRLIRQADARCSEPLFYAAEQLAACDLGRAVGKTVRAALKRLRDAPEESKNMHPWLGALDLQQRIAKGNWRWPVYAQRLGGEDALLRQMLVHYFESFGKHYNDASAKPCFLTAMWSWELRRIIKKYQALLKADDYLWAQVGYALCTKGEYRFVVEWQEDWRQRQNAPPFALWNLLAALAATNRWSEARRLLDHCLGIRQERALFCSFAQFAAVVESLEGRPERAQELLSLTTEEELDSNDRCFRALAETALWLEEQRGRRDWQCFRELIKRLDAGLGGGSLFSKNRMVGNTFKRAIRQWTRERWGLALRLWMVWRYFSWGWILVVLFPVTLPVLLLGAAVGQPSLRRIYLDWRG